jgi:short chain dehydrogenase
MAVALVCGGGGALGSAIVDALLARSDRVVAVDRHTHDGAEVAGLSHEAVDLTSADEVAGLWDRLEAAGDTPRWVVNAAGGFRPGTVAESEPDAVDFVAALNLGTAWWSCREAARRLPEGGAIVNVSSRSALVGGTGAAAYSVSKARVVEPRVAAERGRSRRPRLGDQLPPERRRGGGHRGDRPRLRLRLEKTSPLSHMWITRHRDVSVSVPGHVQKRTRDLRRFLPARPRPVRTSLR